MYQGRWITLGVAMTMTVMMGCQGKTAVVASSGDLPDIVAEVNGDAITKAELDDASAGQLSRLQSQIFQVRKVALDGLIGDRLVAQAAKKDGKTVEEFLNAEVESQVETPSKEMVKGFYEQNKARIGDKPLKEVEADITGFLTNSQRRQLEGALARRLKEGATIATHISPPRVAIELSGDEPSRGGGKDAPITMVEFTDYQCPYCQRTQATVQQVIDTYGDKVRHVVLDFPLSFHAEAFKASEGAHCAGDQGKYFEFNAKLFTSQRDLKIDALKRFAKERDLDGAKFTKCLVDGVHTARVQKNLDYGQQLGVTGTPAFFINGIPLSGARPFADFRSLIEGDLPQP
jgi:protein-disulfide isomerase